jgi:hypothetical protein
LKLIVQEKLNFPIDVQRMIVQGKQMNDTKKLSDYGNKKFNKKIKQKFNKKFNKINLLKKFY